MSGSDAKEELEFYDVSSVAWEPAGAPGLWQRVLAGDKTTGDHTRILRFDPGTVTSETLRHDFWEEVYVLATRAYRLTRGPMRSVTEAVAQ